MVVVKCIVSCGKMKRHKFSNHINTSTSSVYTLFIFAFKVNSTLTERFVFVCRCVEM